MRARRSPKLVAAGVLAVALGALGFAFLYNASNDDVMVVAIAEPLERGMVVEQRHLEVVEVPKRLAVDTLPADKLDGLVGQTTLTDLPRGAFPLATHVGDDPLPAGQALVGLRLTHGQLPTSPLPAGTAVQLVSTGEESAELSFHATVAVAPVMLDDGSFAVDVLLPDADAGTAARLAADGLLALVALGGE